MPLKTLGRHPTQSRLERLMSSPQYHEGTFHNLLPTAITRGGAFFLKTLVEYILSRRFAFPLRNLPFAKTDLLQLPDEKPTIVWFGHSSYLIKYRGKNILVDPVFSGYASPFSFLIKAFRGTNHYQAEDMPFIDMLIITHDHYDHLDYETILALKGKFKNIYTPLGVGEHLEHWGIPSSQIHEFDWWQSWKIGHSIELTATPARHFSGRGFTRGKTLWASFVLKLDQYKIFIGGDSGYDSQFQVIGEKFGPFDTALLECGQYDPDWPLIHMFPEQTAQAAADLRAKVLIPVHWAKFSLALHAWYDPIRRVLKTATDLKVTVATPRIGEPFVLGEEKNYEAWWEEVLEKDIPVLDATQTLSKGSALNSQS